MMIGKLQKSAKQPCHVPWKVKTFFLIYFFHFIKKWNRISLIYLLFCVCLREWIHVFSYLQHIFSVFLIKFSIIYILHLLIFCSFLSRFGVSLFKIWALFFPCSLYIYIYVIHDFMGADVGNLSEIVHLCSST